MELLAVEFVFHAWDTDVCTLLLQNGVSLSEGCEPGAVVQKTLVAHG
jgi:hypothetical protein